MTVERAPFDFEPDETPQEFPAEASVPVPLPRDADGKIVRADWPPPDPDFELPSEAERADEVASTDEASSYDELDANAQAVYVDAEGFEQAQDNIAKLESLPNYAAIESDSAKLPDDAKVAAARLLSRWGQVDNDTLIAEYESLSQWLPLQSAGALREFLEDNGFIEG